MSQVQIQDKEHHKVYAFNRRSRHDDVAARELALEALHTTALETESERRDALRQMAEEVLHAHILEEKEKERRRKEEEEWRRMEEEARRKAEEEERRRKEEMERRARLELEKAQAAARKATEEKAKAKAEAEAEEIRRKEQEEVAREERAERDRIAKKEADREQAEKSAAEQQARQQAQSSQPVVPAPSNVRAESKGTDVESHHRNYLALHQKLKTFRKDFWESAKADRNLKSVVGDMRREMRKSVGQLTDDKVGNKRSVSHI